MDNSACDGQPSTTQTTSQLRQGLAGTLEDGVLSVRMTVDGIDVPNLRSYRVQSPVFAYHTPVDNLNNVFCQPDGSFRSRWVGGVVADGWGVPVTLPAGRHVVNTVGLRPDGSSFLDITYDLTVAS